MCQIGHSLFYGSVYKIKKWETYIKQLLYAKLMQTTKQVLNPFLCQKYSSKTSQRLWGISQ